VSGTLTPDATGNYACAGTYNGKCYYSRADSAYYIWWDEANGQFVISVVLGTVGTAYWTKADTILGVYSPQGTATGDATVGEP